MMSPSYQQHEQDSGDDGSDTLLSNGRKSTWIAPDEWIVAQTNFIKHVKRSLQKDIGKEDFVLAACGAKGLGKSTFLRGLSEKLLQVANKHNAANLERKLIVHFLDTDLGQPERGVPGVVSLTLAASSSRDQLDHAVFVGDVAPSEHPVTYMDSCKHLVETYNSIKEGDPNAIHVLLVNTHGWNIGLGSELVKSVCEAAGLTHCVHLKHETRPDEIDISSWNLASQLKKEFRLPGIVANAAYSASEERFKRFAKYFRASCLAQLEATKPIRVSSTSLNLIESVYVSECSRDDNDSKMLLKRFNGKFVAICRQDNKSNLYEFVALAIVRSVDETSGDILLLTPASTDILDQSGANCLVLGTQTVPLLRWHQADSEAVFGYGVKPFFVSSDQTVLFGGARENQNRSLKRYRLLGRQKK